MNHEFPSPEQNNSAAPLSLMEAEDYLWHMGEAELKEKADNPSIDSDKLRDDLTDMIGRMERRLNADYEAAGGNVDTLLAIIDGYIDDINADNGLRPDEKRKMKSYYKHFQEALIMPRETREELKEHEEFEVPAVKDEVLPETSSKQVEEPVRQERESQARRDIEREFAQDLINDIVTGYPDAVQIHGETRRGLKSYGNVELDGDRNAANRLWNRIKQMKLFPDDRRETDVTKLPVEMVAFTPATETIYKDEVIPGRKRTLFRKGTPDRIRKVPVGERQAAMVNALTGETESAEYVDYTFNPRGRANELAREGKMPEYREIGGVRLGNMVAMRLKLPKSVARQLKAAVEKNPDVIRELLDKSVMNQADGTDMNEELWNPKEKSAMYGHGRPPYEELPEGWKLFMLESDRTARPYDIKTIDF